MFSFIETKLFTKLADEYLSDEEYGQLQQALSIDPESGAVVKGSGGVRKLRWAAKGRGKRHVIGLSTLSGYRKTRSGC